HAGSNSSGVSARMIDEGAAKSTSRPALSSRKRMSGLLPVRVTVASVFHGFKLVDNTFDHRQALAPEIGIARIKAEWRQQFLVVFGAASLQHVEVLLLEALFRVLVDRIKRVHQAVTESIGIDIERRVDEMRDIGPESLVTRI